MDGSIVLIRALTKTVTSNRTECQSVARYSDAKRRFGIVLKLLRSIMRYCTVLYRPVLYVGLEEGGNRHFSDALEGKGFLHVNLDESTIFKCASFCSLLKLFQ